MINNPLEIINFIQSERLNKKTELCKIFEFYGSDKSSDWHNYSPLYYELFKDLRYEKLNIFELGILFGHSVKSWKDFFSNSNIYAGDIDQGLFIKEERIMSFFCNQDSEESIKSLWNNKELCDIKFDIIIDDGKHEFFSNYNFLIGSIDKLKEGGIFIIEDLTLHTMINFESIVEQLKDTYKLKFINILKIKNEKNLIDNNLLLIIK